MVCIQDSRTIFSETAKRLSDLLSMERLETPKRLVEEGHGRLKREAERQLREPKFTAR